MTNRTLLTATLVASAVLSCLTVPTTAHGEPDLTWAAPAQASAGFVYADGLVREAVAVADRYWQRMGFEAQCPAEIYVYTTTDPTHDVAFGDIGGCRVWFDRTLRDGTWAALNARYSPYRERWAALEDLCSTAGHERGHNLGFGHTEWGVMAAPPTTTPTECSTWARTILPKRRNRDKRARKH